MGDSPFILSWNHINHFATQYCQLCFNHFNKRSHREREEPNWSPNIWVPEGFHVPCFLHISILTPFVTLISPFDSPDFESLMSTECTLSLLRQRDAFGAPSPLAKK